jgi:hypothetical protein
MEIKTITFNDSSNNEKMMSVFLLNDDGQEIGRYTFYNKKEEIKIEPEIEKTLETLPNFLKLIYNSGINKEKIIFTQESVDVS